MRTRLLLGGSIACAALALAAACGDRTGLLVGTAEAPADAAADVVIHRDGGPDGDADAGSDALPPLDGTFADVVRPSICVDAGSTLVYVITEQNELYSFYPPTLAFSKIGNIACPATASDSPFSMAVDRKGTAYSVFQSGALFQLSTASAACKATSFAPGQHGFGTFGMGYAANTGDAGETLYVAEGNVTISPRPNSQGLAAIDTQSFVLSYVAPFTPPIPGPELTGTGDGRLFGFYTNADTPGSHIIEIDRTTGRVLADSPLQVGDPSDAYAFAFWGGVFWVFTAAPVGTTGGPTTVTRFDPSTGSESNVATLPSTIVGAGVSTCAPM
jgi:hypothetical protein